MRATSWINTAIVVALCLCFPGHDAYGLGQTPYVVTAGTPGSFPIVQGDSRCNHLCGLPRTGRA